MKKKTPKSSKKNNKSKEKQENIIILAIFLIFIAVVAYLLYFINLKTSNDDVVAVVNGVDITRDDMDWWYKVSVNPQYQDFVTKQDFLTLSLIPQEILIQQAKKENIKATTSYTEQLLGIYIIDNGMTLDEFENNLKSRDLTIDDIKRSFESRSVIIKLMQEKGFISGDSFEEISFDAADASFGEYLDELINKSDIEIFTENIEKLELSSFESTGEVCDEEKPVVRLYTSTTCKACKGTAEVFKSLVKEFGTDVNAIHWSLDTGDNLLTSRKENGIPQKEIEIFKKYSPKKLVPTTVLGCEYKRVGSLGTEEEVEFKVLLKKLIGE